MRYVSIWLNPAWSCRKRVRHRPTMVGWHWVRPGWHGALPRPVSPEAPPGRPLGANWGISPNVLRWLIALAGSRCDVQALQSPALVCLDEPDCHWAHCPAERLADIDLPQ